MDDVRVYTKSNPKLTHAEIERLALVALECGQLTAMIGRIITNGYAPGVGGQGADLRRQLEIRLGAMFAAVDVLNMRADVDAREINLAAADRKRALRRYVD